MRTHTSWQHRMTVAMFGIGVLFFLATVTLAAYLLLHLPESLDKGRNKYNQCREQGGSVSWCGFGLK